MQNNLERLIKIVYKKYKAGHKPELAGHPDEETLACFIEKKLSAEKGKVVERHLLECLSCAKAVAVQLKAGAQAEADVPLGMVAAAKGIFAPKKMIPVLEVFLQLKAGLLELLSTNGDVLFGQELVPAPVLRSRQVKDFKDEVVILKDLGNIRVEIKVEKRPASAFSLSVIAKDRQNSQVIKDLRVTLIRQGLELESYINDLGKVIFEHVALGKYTVEIADLKEKLAEILLDIKA